MYYQPHKHRQSAEIIKRYSSNKEDIRNLINSCINYDDVHSILDLGCGYGSFYEKSNFPHGCETVGVDINESNREFFLERTSACRCKGIFLQEQLPKRLDFPDFRFHLILSLYSLYFFVEMLPEIKRLLNPEGCFVAVTHCSESFRELNVLIEDARLFSILRNFSDLNGKTILSRYFSEIKEISYPNSLLFPSESREDLIAYLQFKKPLWFSPEREERIEKHVTEKLIKEGQFQISKNDIIYICKP